MTMRKLILYSRTHSWPKINRKRVVFDVTGRKRFEQVIMQIFQENRHCFGDQEEALKKDERDLVEAKAVRTDNLPQFLKNRVRTRIDELEDRQHGIRSQRIDAKLWRAAMNGHASSAYQLLQRKSGYGFHMEVLDIK